MAIFSSWDQADIADPYAWTFIVGLWTFAMVCLHVVDTRRMSEGPGYHVFQFFFKVAMPLCFYAIGVGMYFSKQPTATMTYLDAANLAFATISGGYVIPVGLGTFLARYNPDKFGSGAGATAHSLAYIMTQGYLAAAICLVIFNAQNNLMKTLCWVSALILMIAIFYHELWHVGNDITVPRSRLNETEKRNKKPGAFGEYSDLDGNVYLFNSYGVFNFGMLMFSLAFGLTHYSSPPQCVNFFIWFGFVPWLISAFAKDSLYFIHYFFVGSFFFTTSCFLLAVATQNPNWNVMLVQTQYLTTEVMQQFGTTLFAFNSFSMAFAAFSAVCAFMMNLYMKHELDSAERA